MRAYRRLFVAGVRRQSTYRLAALGGLVANVTFGVLKAAVLGATVAAAGGSVAGYDAAAMAAYVWLSQALLGSVNLVGRSDFALRVRSGEVAVDFLRPLDVQAATVVTEVGGSLFLLLPRGVPLVAVGLLVGGLPVPDRTTAWVLGPVAVVLGVTLAAAAVYVVSAAGFWLVDNRGLQILYMVASGFLSGLFVPVALFPDWLGTLARATPFPSMLMTPVDVLSGRVAGGAAVVAVGVSAAWLAGVALLGHVLTRAGRRRLEVQGG